MAGDVDVPGVGLWPTFVREEFRLDRSILQLVYKIMGTLSKL